MTTGTIIDTVKERDRFEEIETLAHQATPGPWALHREHLAGPTRHEPFILIARVASGPVLGEIDRTPDALFISAAREAVPVLCRTIRDLERERVRLNARLETMITQAVGWRAELDAERMGRRLAESRGVELRREVEALTRRLPKSKSAKKATR